MLCAALLFFGLFPAAASKTPVKDFAEEVRITFDARKKHSGNVETLLDCSGFLTKTENGPTANSSTYTDWMALAMGRFSVVNSDGKPLFLYKDAQTAYLAGMDTYITQTYAENGGMLSKSKVTEAQRCALTVAALGGNPCSIGSFQEKPVNLIADGSYNCPLNITRQGMMGIVFALISKNACNVQTPQTVRYTDEFFYTYLFERELPDGGWALTGTVPDPDVTAMTLCALALNRNNPAVFAVKREADGAQVSTTIGAAVERALNVLSRIQCSNGGFASAGNETCESSAQVLTALCMCGVDAETDARFLKDGNSVLDALYAFRLPDGSFAHVKAGAGKHLDYNTMATDQSAYALVALWRFKNDLRGLYDMRPDLSQPLAVLVKAIVHYFLKSLQALSTGT